MVRGVQTVPGYAGAVAVAAVAVAVRWQIDPVLGERVPFAANFVAVLLAAWFGGLGPGLAALTLSAGASVYLFVPPRGTFSLQRTSDVVGVGLFLLNGTVIVLACEAQRSAKRRAEVSALAARRALAAEQGHRDQLRTTLDGISDGVIVADARGHVTLINPAAERLTGWPAVEAEGRPLGDVLRVVDEPTRQPTESPAGRVLSEGGLVAMAEHAALVARDGSARPVDGTASPVRGDDGTTRGVVVVVRDVTGRRRADEALRHSERLFRFLADAMPQFVWVADPEGKVRYLNQRWFEYTGLTAFESFAPNGTLAAIHPDDVANVLESAARSAREGTPFEAEFRLRHRTGHFRWHLGRSVPVLDENGREVRRIGTATDIDDRKRAEHDARFLAAASALLATTLDEEVALRHLARLAVPFFADWCLVDLAAEDGSIRRLTVSHADPEKTELAAQVARRFPPDPDAARGISQVLRTGRPLLVAEVDDGQLAAASRGEEHPAIMQKLGVRSFLSVPLTGRGGTLGAVTFLSAESGRRFGEGDLRLAEDLAHRAAIALENVRLTAELKATDRKKDEFLATLAHELRNPLAPVRNALYLMSREAGADPAFAQEREMLERQVGHLARLVDDLLDVSRINQGKLGLRKQTLELAPVVRQAVEATHSLFAEKGHELVVSVPPEPVTLEADPTRLEQVLWNLLNNAAKYTEPGGRVELAVTRECDTATVLVRDTGIGIEPEVLPRVFDLFVQADRQDDRSRGGLGIGLSLVRELVRMHGGTIEALSGGLGRGSEFVVRLPVAPAAEAVATDGPPAPETGHPSPSAPPRRRVLVVDDNVDAATSLVRLLTRLYGQEVRVAHDGPSAVTAACEFRPEVVFLDIGLPGMDGYEVARRLRADHPECDGSLLVAVTGWGQDADRDRSRDAGFDRHLVKPVDPDVLRGLLCDLVAPAGRP